MNQCDEKNNREKKICICVLYTDTFRDCALSFFLYRGSINQQKTTRIEKKNCSRVTNLCWFKSHSQFSFAFVSIVANQKKILRAAIHLTTTITYGTAEYSIPMIYLISFYPRTQEKWSVKGRGIANQHIGSTHRACVTLRKSSVHWYEMQRVQTYFRVSTS